MDSLTLGRWLSHYMMWTGSLCPEQACSKFTGEIRVAYDWFQLQSDGSVGGARRVEAKDDSEALRQGRLLASAYGFAIYRGAKLIGRVPCAMNGG